LQQTCSKLATNLQLKSKTKHKKKKAMLQQQKSFMIVRNKWKQHQWTESETNKWKLFCERNPISNKKGQLKNLFPYTAFLKVNIPRVNLNLSIIYEPPLL